MTPLKLMMVNLQESIFYQENGFGEDIHDLYSNEDVREGNNCGQKPK